MRLLYKANQPSLQNFDHESEVLMENDDNLNSEISIDEVHRSINKLKSGKSQGPDGLQAEFYKQTCYEIAPFQFVYVFEEYRSKW